ncbi:MAG TPA: DNA polymerase I [Elusimicrobiales bacterium]|nr:DNA polymerase I [Elusimicrobiales bacterium]
MISEKNLKNTLFVIDAHSFIHRAYHAMPRLTSGGREIGALYGFTRFIVSILKKEPGFLALCFDTPAKTFRHKMYPDYKAHRPKTDDALIEQIKETHEIVKTLKLPLIAKEGYEADDVLAFLTHKATDKGLDVVLVTSDKDSYQLVSDKVFVSHGAKGEFRGAEFVKEKFGVTPEQIIDYLAIVGDSVDNVPGITGIGAKTAAKLLNEFGTLENIIATAKKGAEKSITKNLATKIVADEKKVMLSKKLVTLESNLPIDIKIDDLKVKPLDQEGVVEVIKKYGFKSLANLVKPQETVSKPFKSENLQNTLKALENAKKVFLQTHDGFLIIGKDADTFSVVKIDSLTEQDKEAIKNMLATQSVDKISYDLKKTIYKLRLHVNNYETINVFDLKLACYLLDPSRTNYDFAGIILDYAGEIANPQNSQDMLVMQNKFAFKLKEILQKELEQKKLAKLYYETEIPILSILASMETEGIEVDTVMLKKLSEKLETETKNIQQEINKQAKEDININSPKQLAELLFEKMKIPPVKKIKTGYSTDEDVLSRLAEKYDIAKKILKYRQSAKLKSTYVDNFIKIANPENSRVYTHFDQTKTATGRLASIDPNLQNIPLTSQIRTCFKAKKGYVFLSADYSQIDLRVLAHESGDKNLISAFKNGEDVHTKTAAEVFEVMHSLVTPQMRKTAKAINFGIVYGQTGIGLSQLLKIPHASAKEYIKHYFKTYVGVKEWIDKTLETAKKQGFVKTLSGRIRYFPQFKGKAFREVKAAERAAINTVIQGGSADIIKFAMIEIYKLMKNHSAKMILQVHDELIFEVKKDEAPHFAALVKQKMEHAAKLNVPLSADLKIGSNWHDMKPVRG